MKKNWEVKTGSENCTGSNTSEMKPICVKPMRKQDKPSNIWATNGAVPKRL